MKSTRNAAGSNDMDQILNQLLADKPLRPSPDSLKLIRQRMRQEAEAPDAILDNLFAMDPTFRIPGLAQRIRTRLAGPTRDTASAQNWFAWLTPVAAACVLGLSLFTFQQKGPVPHSMQRAEVHSHQQTEDTELTQIFALASNLHASADVSGIKSFDDIAHLFN